MPKLQTGRSGDAGVGAEAGADPARHPGGGDLLGPDRVVELVAALAAEPLGVLEAEEAELGGAVEELARELAPLLPLVLEGDDLGLDPAADRRPQLLVLVLERGLQRARAAVLDDGHRRMTLPVPADPW